MKAVQVDPAILEFATPTQRSQIEAIIEHGSMRAAALALGLNFSTVHGALNAAKTKAAIQHGVAPGLAGMNGLLAPGESLKGRSIYYDPRTAIAEKVWVKTDVKAEEALRIMRVAAEALADDLPRVPPLPAPEQTNDRLLNVYTMTDCHVGMLAWGKETGEPWDLDIAERTLVGCFAAMVSAAPNARTAYVNQLGDFMHTDGMKNLTPENGNLLDADGRFPKMVRVAVRILRRLVDLALAKHEIVYVLLAEGNHDPASSIWLRAMFAALYENEPRVRVVESEFPYYCHAHGKTMVAFHHGHLKKTDQLPLLFAATFSKIWGDTTKRYCHTGHRHHTEEKEHAGMTVFQHPTLAARDAYAARGGWVSERSATAVTYHAQFGEVARVTVTPEMLEAA